jgi:hypothetical protein
MRVRPILAIILGAIVVGCSSDDSPSSAGPGIDAAADATGDGAIDCSKVGCAAPPPCGETCKEPCGCCPNPACADSGKSDTASEGGADTSDAAGEGGTDAGDDGTGGDVADDVPPLVDDAPPHEGGGFVDAAGLCTASDRANRLRDMVLGTITLPNHAATLDLLGDGFGLTLGEAETKLCASKDLGDSFGDGSRTAAFGDSDEMYFVYYPLSGRGRWMNLWPGTIGTLTAKSPDGAHTYTLGIAVQIQKDGSAFTLKSGWSATDATFAGQVDELYRALVHTYAPTVTLPAAGTTCIVDKTCVVGAFGADIGYVFVKSLGFSFWVDNRAAADPVPSIPTRFDVDLVK